MMSATIPSQWNVLHPLTLVPSAERNETMLTSVTRDQSSRRRALKAASSHKPNQCPYTACNPSASFTRGMVRILCPVVVVASSPPSEQQLAALQRFNSTCCQRHGKPAHLSYAVLGSSWPNDHRQALDALDSLGSMSRSIVSRSSCQAQWAVIFAPHSPRLSGLHWSSRLRSRVLWCIAVSQKSSRPSVSPHRGVSSSNRSRCSKYQPSSERIAQLARLFGSRATLHPSAAVVPIQYSCAYRCSPYCP